MKRCPQCEFIYEDDQSLCDMDGILLVFDSRTLPNHHALATVPARKSQRRNRAVPAFATVILALVLAMVYYVSTRRSTAPQTYSPANVTSTSDPAPMSIPTPEAQPSESPKEEAPKEEAKPASTKQPAKKPAVKTQTKTSTEPKKEDSKVGSILKKTGRILKKPFKF
jgi:outer membrane biosynthesis protein TonB